jgi:ATP-binding cassette, subfamily F, member 3
MIQLDNLGVFLPTGYLFQNITAQINKGDKVGLVGKNGAGKSTILKLISGKDKPSEGNIHSPKDTTIGYLSQDLLLDTTKSVFDFLNDSNVELNRIGKRLDKINRYTNGLRIRKLSFYVG